MKRVKVASTALGLIIGILAVEPASAWTRGTVNDFFTLPALVGQPAGSGVISSVEGLTVGSDGNIYAASSGFNNGKTPGPTGPANLFVISPGSRLVKQLAITDTSVEPPTPLASENVLGIRFNPSTNALWLLDNGNKQILSFTNSTNVFSVLAAGFPATATLNALTFDNLGQGYVTDSANGAIYKVPQLGGAFAPSWTWSSDPRLKPLTGPANLLPSVGANGIELSPPGCGLGFPIKTCKFALVANTANRNIVKILISSDGTAVPGASTFTNGINGPDGLAIDKLGNIWVAANQSDEIVVIQQIPTQVPDIGTEAKVIAKLGDFHSITGDGTINGLLFPANIAFSNDGATLYVANFANTQQRSIDSFLATQVQHYTISSITVPTLPTP
jgi:sugar lactone lactonase YvrE